MQTLPFIPKEDAALPDWWGMTIYYVDGKKEDFEVASHKIGQYVFEFVTKDDVWNWVQLTSIKRIEFDKRFSAMVALKAEKERADAQAKA